MKLLAVNDYVIWKKEALCKIIHEITRGPDHFLGLEKPIAERYEQEVRPAGLTEDDFIQTFNDTSTWLVKDDKTGKEFKVTGFHLLPVPAMMVIALMARKEDEGHS